MSWSSTTKETNTWEGGVATFPNLLGLYTIGAYEVGGFSASKDQSMWNEVLADTLSWVTMGHSYSGTTRDGSPSSSCILERPCYMNFGLDLDTTITLDKTDWDVWLYNLSTETDTYLGNPASVSYSGSTTIEIDIGGEISDYNTVWRVDIQYRGGTLKYDSHGYVPEGKRLPVIASCP